MKQILIAIWLTVYITANPGLQSHPNIVMAICAIAGLFAGYGLAHREKNNG